jgi:hypothetical protein
VPALRAASPQRALAALHRSRAWRSHSGLITRDSPADIWRELCWWYVVYPGRDGPSANDIVFAVEVKTRHPAVHAAVVSRIGDQGGWIETAGPCSPAGFLRLYKGL